MKYCKHMHLKAKGEELKLDQVEHSIIKTIVNYQMAFKLNASVDQENSEKKMMKTFIAHQNLKESKEEVSFKDLENSKIHSMKEITLTIACICKYSTK